MDSGWNISITRRATLLAVERPKRATQKLQDAALGAQKHEEMTENDHCVVSPTKKALHAVVRNFIVLVLGNGESYEYASSFSKRTLHWVFAARVWAGYVKWLSRNRG